MANVITFLGNRILPREVIKRFSVTFSGNYANGGAVGVPGETLNFNAALNPNKLARPKIPAGPPAARLPLPTSTETPANANGYTFQVEPNAVAPTPANFVGRFFAGGSGAANPAELASASYASYGITATTTFVVEFAVPAKYN
jgi:hypothetical protein